MPGPDCTEANNVRIYSNKYRRQLMARYPVCAENDLAVGEMKALKAGNTKIIVYHLEDGFYATQASCTHIFAPLAKGKIVEECQVQCPFHRARFDVRTGEVKAW